MNLLRAMRSNIIQGALYLSGPFFKVQDGPGSLRRGRNRTLIHSAQHGEENTLRNKRLLPGSPLNLLYPLYTMQMLELLATTRQILLPSWPRIVSDLEDGRKRTLEL